MESAAEWTIGKTAATTSRVTPHCSEMASMSVKQRQLKLWQQNTKATTREDIKRQRNTLLHAMGRKYRDNAEARLDRISAGRQRGVSNKLGGQAFSSLHVRKGVQGHD